MGQRHQVFVKVLNPVHFKYLTLSKSEKEEAKKIFGTKKTTILAFHHQWLYGRSAAVAALNILHVSNQNEINAYGSPFSDKFRTSYGNNNLKDYITAITTMVSVQWNKLHPRGLGIESFWFLNEEDPEMREDFTLGDNNDGVTIIDTLTRKYCMMNIDSYDDNKELYDVHSLPLLKPVSARDYMKAYYGETFDTTNPYCFENKTDMEIQKIVGSNIIGNAEIDLEFYDFKVLTESEVNKLFPKMELSYASNKKLLDN